MSTDPTPGTLLVGRYRLREALGRGAHGVVFLADDLARGGAQVALKWVGGLVGGEPESSAEQILRWFRHPGWAEILDVGRCGEHDWFQALQYVAGQDLSQVDEPLPEDEVWRFLTQMARVLRAMHARGLIHYDITPGNVLCEVRKGERHYILTDGGLAHVGPIRGVARGTPAYMAPEVTEDAGHDHRVDLYSLGLLAFRLATGRDVFEGKASQVLVRRRRERAPDIQRFVPAHSDALARVIGRLLEIRPNNRPADAEALLHEIRLAHDTALPDLTAAEALAAAGGGPLVGRDERMDRFERTLEDVARLLPVRPGGPVQGPCTALTDPVVLLRGPTGAGSTRMLAEFVARARAVDMPVVLMAAPEAPVDGLRRLEELAAALHALGRGAEEGEDTTPAPRGRRDVEPSVEHARWMERLVPLAEDAARRTPFLIAIEAYAQWPTELRAVLDVLVRHVASRHVHGGKGARPPILVAVDVGSGSPEALRVPDASNPEGHEWALEPLNPGQLADLLVSKFPQLRIDPVDAQAVHTQAGGLPGGAAHLLGVAAARGDFTFEAGWLVWQLDELAQYDAGDGLPTHLHHAVDAESTAGRQWLRFMAILRAPLSEATFKRLGDVAVATTEPSQDLLTRFRSGNRHYVRLAHPALATRLLENVPTEREVEALLAFLDREAHRAPLVPTLRIACARLLAARERKDEALQTLLGIERNASPELRVEAVQTAIDFLPPMPAALGTIERLATLLPQSNAGAAVGAHLLDITGPDQYAPTAYVALRCVFSTSNRPELTLQMGGPREVEADPARGIEALSLYSGHLDAAGKRMQARAALLKTRAVRLSSGVRLPPVVRQTLLWAWGDHLRKYGKPRLALACLQSAVGSEGAPRTGTSSARAWLGVGIGYAMLGQPEQARRAWVRSARLFNLEASTRDVLASRYNIARLAVQSGRLRDASIAARSCAAIASRHGLRRVLSRSLALLSSCLDADGRGKQAALMINRALISARGDYPRERLALLESRAAVVALSTGSEEAADPGSSSLLQGARDSTPRSTSRCFGHYALLDLSLQAGHNRRIRRHASYLASHGTDVHTESGAALSSVAGALSTLAGAVKNAPEPIGRLWRYRNEGEIRDLLRALCLLRSGVPTEARLTHALGRMRTGMGRRRLLASMLNSLSSDNSLPLASARKLCEQTGDDLLLARLNARAAAQLLRARLPEGIRQASQAIASVTTTFRAIPALRRKLLPPEFRQLAVLLSPERPTNLESGDILTELNAIAHTALASNPVANEDDRRTQALRNALELGARLRADEPLDRLLEDLTHHAAALTGAERACVVHVDENGELVLEVSSDAQHTKDGPQFSHSVINRVLRYRRPLLWTDVFEDEELFGKQSVEAMRLNSVMCVPMLLGDELYGVLYADNTARAAAFDDTDLDVLCLFAQLAANALHSQTMISRLRRSKEEIAELQGRMIAGERLRVIGELSSGVAHEFNNLLTSILARVQLINLEAQSASLRPDLNMIEKACLDAAEVVRRLQSFGKTQQQKDFERLDLGEIARDAVEFLRPLWADKTGTRRRQVSVAVVCPSPVTVSGNPTELREIVTNLVKNALEAMPEKGDIRVEIAETGGNILLAVRDNGQGMSPEIQRRAFDPFFTTKGERGTGLGLCLVRQIVERHGGQMEIHSVAGTGTTVQMRFPSEAADSYAVLPPTPGEDAPARLRVLVVDDDDDVRTPLCRYLEKQGYEVYSASSGSKGLEIAQAEQPDVVISDVRMPGMDGLQLCEALHQSLPKAPVVLMSGWASGVDPARAQAVGASTLLAKPFAMQQVAELLSELAK